MAAIPSSHPPSRRVDTVTQDEKHISPWQTLTSKEIYQNPWLRLREDQVINPNGGRGIYGVVEFQNRAVGIIPVDEQGYTWLVGQYRYATQHYSWEIPMGGHPINADPLQGARKELKEETGFSAAQFTELLQVHISNSVTNEEGIVYLATGLTPGNTDFDETEQITLKRLPLSEAIGWAKDGTIKDCLSVTGLLRLEAHLASA